MNYFVTQDWASTKGNHAGMVHLCNLISAKYPNEVRHIVVPALDFKFSRIFFHVFYFCLAVYLALKLKGSDKLFLMEYLLPTRRQDYIAYWVKKVSKCKIIALAHLTPYDLNKYYPEDSILQKWCDKVDVLMTLGSSLTNYLNKRVHNCRIETAFHYVDLDYYSLKEGKVFDKKRAIFMGNMKRDFESLEKIVSNCPNVDFVYLKGRSKRDTSNLDKYSNLKILGYISEEDLKQEMANSNISLNLMYDTIGSNVITTSLAMGLCMFVSNVGSIHDYCKDDCSVFCNNVDEFIENLNSVTLLDIESMSNNSIILSKGLSFDSFYSIIESY